MQWTHLVCAVTHEEVSFTKGTSKTTPWSQESNVADEDTPWQVTNQKIMLDVEGEQKCLWQWTLKLHRPPGLGDVQTGDEFH